jgi:hypothetical protein
MRSKFIVLALLAVLFALPSRADSIDNTLTDAFFSTDIVSFSLPVNPLPTNADSTGFSIQFVSVDFDGTLETLDIFMDATQFMVLVNDFPNLPMILVNLYGSDMPFFSGSPAHPTLLAGTFRFSSDGEAKLTTKLVSSTSPVPEPSSLHLLAAGMLLALFFKLRP